MVLQTYLYLSFCRMSSLEQTLTPAGDKKEEDDTGVFDPLATARSALSANSEAFWQSEGARDLEAEAHPHAAEGSQQESSPSSCSADPAGEAVEELLSRSMDHFMQSFREDHPQRGNTSAARSSNNSTSIASSSRNYTTSPQRLSRTTSLFEGVQPRGRDSSKRYMQLTESMCLSRSQSPQHDAAAAMEWVNEPLTRRPLWKINTFRSPDWPRTSPGVPRPAESRGNSTSPGARTAASLIDRLSRQDRSALFSRMVGASRCSDSGEKGVQGVCTSLERKDSTEPVAVPEPDASSTISASESSCSSSLR